MPEHELLYQHSSVAISAILFFAILVAYEASFRFGARRGDHIAERIKPQTNAIQAAILGLLALLLGFSFTMALQRFDARSNAVIEEVNAIRTAALRTRLVPEPESSRLRATLQRYVELRIAAGGVNLVNLRQREAFAADVAAIHDELWSDALEAAEKDARAVTSGLFIQSLNQMIDAYGKRSAALDKHVPEIVFLLLFSVFIIAGCVLGYASGLDVERHVGSHRSLAEPARCG